MRCLIFNKSGVLTHNIDKSSLETQNIPFIKRKDNIRDLKQITEIILTTEIPIGYLTISNALQMFHFNMNLIKASILLSLILI